MAKIRFFHKWHIHLTHKVLMDFRNRIAGMAFALRENNFRIGMPFKYTHKFPSRVAGSTYYAYLDFIYHNSCSSFSPSSLWFE